MRNTRSLRRPALVAAAVVATVTLAACGTTEAGGDATRASGPAAPEFTLQTLEGDTFTLADHLGDVVVLEFLAPGCASCTVDLAGLAKAAEEKPNATLLVADVSGADPDALRDYYRDQLDVTPEVLIAPDSDFDVTKAYNASALGHTVVITPEGSVSWKGRWTGDESKLFEQIDQATGS